MVSANASTTECNHLAGLAQCSNDNNAASIDHLESSAPEVLNNCSSSSRIAFGSLKAISQLKVRLDSLCSDFQDPPSHELSACKMAFEILQQTRIGAISVLAATESNHTCPCIAALTWAPPWLQSFILQPCELLGTLLLPQEPLTRLLLSFYALVSQEYLDLVLPLLDQRLEAPVDASSDWFALSLTRTQACALDIYAHWSVLMSLVEEKSWWIGRLPVATLDGVLNRYGTGFTQRLWPECEEQGEWWPGEMLRVLRDTRTDG
jgi:hypothetical protein